MSNRATIQQETTIIHKTQQTTKSVCVFDSYGEGCICLDDYCDTFYENDMELLLFVLETVKNGEHELIDTILSYAYENENGMYIEGKWYNWEKIQPVFEKAGY